MSAEETEEALPFGMYLEFVDTILVEELDEAFPIVALFDQEILVDLAEETDEASGTAQFIDVGMADETDSSFTILPPAPPVEVTLEFGSIGLLGFVTDLIVTNPILNLSVLEDAVERAPTTITVSISGGEPLAPFIIEIDGNTVYSGTFNSEGGMGLTSMPVLPEWGAAGSHTVTVTQVALTGDTVTDDDTFIVVLDPIDYPTGPGTDAPAVAVVNPAQRWVFQDPLPGGLGSWIMPANPRTMTSPHFERVLKSRHTTAKSGQYHVTEGGHVVKQWTFGGYTPYQEVVEQLQAYFALQRRIYIIDHRNRAWKVVIEAVEITARLQQIFDDDPTDWGHDWQVTATILDQNWTVPE